MKTKQGLITKHVRGFLGPRDSLPFLLFLEDPVAAGVVTHLKRHVRLAASPTFMYPSLNNFYEHWLKASCEGSQ